MEYKLINLSKLIIAGAIAYNIGMAIPFYLTDNDIFNILANCLFVLSFLIYSHYRIDNLEIENKKLRKALVTEVATRTVQYGELLYGGYAAIYNQENKKNEK